MIEKMKTISWFLQRPTYWPHMTALALRKFYRNYDDPKLRSDAGNWAAERAVSIGSALAAIGLKIQDETIPALDPALLTEAHERASQSAVEMGGPGDLSLIYAAIVLSGAKTIIETGVAYGWSSLAILAAMHDRDAARLFSVDMPYPKRNNEAFVGIVVPQNLRRNWTIIREPDRRGVEKAIARAGGMIDLCHYDSDKSYWGRQYAYPLLWDALRPGGIFISDDIQDNFAFKEFVEQKRVPFATVRSGGKYVGIARKQLAS